MCVCFNHSNLVPTAEPSGDRKQRYGMKGHGGRRGTMERGMTEGGGSGGRGVRNKRDERGG